MLRLRVVCGVLCCAFVLVYSNSDMGPGRWKAHYIKKCEELIHKFKFNVRQNKINRTHDGFNADLFLDEAFTDAFGVRIDICKYVDGGCKPCQVLHDKCLIDFINKYAENNVKACLESAGVNPPEFPVKKGEYHVTDFVFDYTELPDDGIYGYFGIKSYILQGSQEVGCVELYAEFKENEEYDDDDYDG